MSTTLLIAPPAGRAARATAKRQAILDYLASETWSDTATIADMLGLSVMPAYRALNAAMRDGEVKRLDLQTGLRSRIVIWGITPVGILHSNADPATTSEFEQSRVSPTHVAHKIGIQRMRNRALRAGWSDWRPSRELRYSEYPCMPDAVATAPSGRRVAIEFERHVKSEKRREEILGKHILALSAKHWQLVVYVADFRTDPARLRSRYLSTKKIRMPSGLTDLTDAHKARFRFVSLDDFPHNAGV